MATGDGGAAVPAAEMAPITMVSKSIIVNSDGGGDEVFVKMIE